jgi:hypothetical protein
MVSSITTKVHVAATMIRSWASVSSERGGVVTALLIVALWLGRASLVCCVVARRSGPQAPPPHPHTGVSPGRFHKGG